MTDNFTPITGQDIRIRFEPEERLFLIEQAVTRRANGATDPNDIAGIIGLNTERWEILVRASSVLEAFERTFHLMYEENYDIRAVDLGPVPSDAPAILETRDQLNRVRFS